MNKARAVVFAMALAAPFASAPGQQQKIAASKAGDTIASMDELRFAPPKDKGSASLVDGRFGHAVRFRFAADSSSSFFTSNIHGTPAWDQAEGFSFWVRGEDQAGFGGIEFIYDDDYAVRYDLCFPIRPREWTKVVVAWRDLVPVLPGPRSRPLGLPGGNLPSKLSAIFVGRWWYWSEYPALSFDLDEIRLEPRVQRPSPPPLPRRAPLERTRAKLKAGRPVTVVTMGDSLTDKRHWANREVAWVDLLRDALKRKFGAEVTIVNPAIGGTQLRQNVILIPRWLARAPQPDLVILFFGGNDWDAGMRGDEFHLACLDAVDRVRQATNGKSDVLIVTTNPSAARWGALEELAEACRRAAQDRRAGLADTDRAFIEAGKDHPDGLFVHDRVHLSRTGHTVVAETIARTIDSAGALPPERGVSP